MTRREAGLQGRFPINHNPIKTMPYIMLGKVIDTRRSNNAVDVSLLPDGGIVRNCQVIQGAYGTDYGHSSLPTPDNLYNVNQIGPGGRIDSPELSGQRNILAVLTYLNGDMSNPPVVLGFLPPQLTQVAFKDDADIAVQLHPNGAYTVRQNNPDDYPPDDRIYFQAVMPDLSYLIVGGHDSPIDITPLSEAGNWKPKGGDVRKVAMGHGPTNTQLVIEQSGLITIKHILSGMVLTVDPATQALKITGAQAVEIDAVKTVKLSSTETITITAPAINLNGAISVNGTPLDVP